MLQGNIAQEEKWDPALRDAITERYIDDDARRRSAQGATFILWPESATPFYFEHDLRARRSRSAGWRARRSVTLLIGSDQVEPIKAAARDRRRRRSATTTPRFWCKPDGTIGAVYRKMHLVPFGEYVPLKSLLFFVGPIVEAVVGLHAGHRAGAAAGRRPPRRAPRSATR